MKVEQTSKLIKGAKGIIQRLVNTVVGAMKINSQEIARPSVITRSIYANQRQQVWWIHPTRQNIKKKNMTHALARLLASVRKKSYMSVHPKPWNAYYTNFFGTRSILSMCAP
jgi:CRISPR/Cas system-associated endonuclease Cas1